ncbi:MULTISPECIES: hypothetical protein [Planktothricoides]|uniref:Uncharacterized protein n=1 Tax=Planktothricoides raciborskii FACHB-1370 TaxID=2949576 RepID=A0ABR8EDZ4_9CYAN|nr:MULTISPECIES: hypothetical protein [Planktothricoides]KOR38491.1 hypothetical protein AM228_00385 [Planktothricoides sp. SR001]MBD2544542.1 hypothetical protein [Planktothricoides raciborskii FACHB-1370]MBD2585548.1 hypothetical protein [Planktothricoides raciborskii FACHB-1261]
MAIRPYNDQNINLYTGMLRPAPLFYAFLIVNGINCRKNANIYQLKVAHNLSAFAKKNANTP